MLDVSGLSVRAGAVNLVHDVSLSLTAGEHVGLIGESGSGKSLTALALLGLLPEGVRATGSVRLDGVGHDLIGASERQLGRIRGRKLAMVFQEPMTALNPTMRVGRQVAEAMRIHRTVPDPRAAALDLLDRVHLPDPTRVARAFPHQLSGGQRQRVVLAIALANRPKVLLCDEPTTALDVTVQAQMLDIIAAGVAEAGAALLFITHDLAVMASLCQRVLVMYGGRVVESGPVKEVLGRPRHPYTKGLLDSCDLDASVGLARLPTIPGTVPAAGQFPAGCVFRNRCAHATARCAELPATVAEGPRTLACWHPIEADAHAS